MMQDAQPLGGPIDRWFFWSFLGGVALAEVITAAVEARAGVLLHLVLLTAALLYAALAARPAARSLATALVLAPLIRLLALAMPLSQLPQLAWYPAVSIPLLIAAWIIIRQTGLGRADLAIRVRKPLVDAAVILSGVSLGVIEFTILGPGPIIAAPTLGGLGLTFVVLTLFTGLVEELIFRGILQSLGLRILGAPALAFSALLFGALHIGYLSLVDLAFVTAVGMIFTLAVYHGVSLYAVTLAHGLTNFTLFALAPLLSAGLLPAWAVRGVWPALAASGAGLGVLLMVAAGAWLRLRPRPQAPGAAPQAVAAD